MFDIQASDANLERGNVVLSRLPLALSITTLPHGNRRSLLDLVPLSIVKPPGRNSNSELPSKRVTTVRRLPLRVDHSRLGGTMARADYRREVPLPTCQAAASSNETAETLRNRPSSPTNAQTHREDAPKRIAQWTQMPLVVLLLLPSHSATRPTQLQLRLLLRRRIPTSENEDIATPPAPTPSERPEAFAPTFTSARSTAASREKTPSTRPAATLASLPSRTFASTTKRCRSTCGTAHCPDRIRLRRPTSSSQEKPSRRDTHPKSNTPAAIKTTVRMIPTMTWTWPVRNLCGARRTIDSVSRCQHPFVCLVLRSQ